jgi:site-specific DNA-methyltransferase (adenine-specific)
VETNARYYGDNLAILRDRIPEGSVDLVYLDPPFNSNRDYNAIFKDESGAKSDAQHLAWGRGILAVLHNWNQPPSCSGTR